jgi:hypothetical protein
MTQPADTGGAETQICYLFVADAVAHCDRAKTAGAEIVLDIEDADSNGRGYSCRDLEGHVWNFGTYDPWKRRAAPAGGSNRYSAGLRGGLRRLAVAAGMVVVIIASAMVVGWARGVTDAAYPDLGTAASTSVAEAAAHPQQAGEVAERAVKDFKEQLARERGAREAAERIARSAREQLGQERAAKEAAERAAREASGRMASGDTERALEDVRQQLARERSALETAQRVAQEARELAAERSAREVAELAAQQARQQLAKEQQGAKDAAERAAKEAREEEAKERVAKRSPPPRPRPVQSLQSGSKPFILWDQ